MVLNKNKYLSKNLEKYTLYCDTPITYKQHKDADIQEICLPLPKLNILANTYNGENV